MNILDIAKQRFSVRNYLTKEISQETLETILEAAHVAPTAANMQPVKLLVVKSDEAKEKLAKAANIYSAPATELGLGSVWICYFKPDVIKEEFKLPLGLEPINILAIGYTNEKADANRHESQRLPMKEFVSFL